MIAAGSGSYKMQKGEGQDEGIAIGRWFLHEKILQSNHSRSNPLSWM
jgi:hypothetical protein